MANVQLGTGNLGVVDKRRGALYANATQSSHAGVSIATPANYGSIDAMRTRLAAANGAYYTAARLNQMSYNDMIYALRTIDDAAGL